MSIFECSIAEKDEILNRFTFDIATHPEDAKWTAWIQEIYNNFNNHKWLLYIGKLDGKTICDAIVILSEEYKPSGNSKKLIDDPSGLVTKDRAFIFLIHTDRQYRGKHYFSTLYKFIENDLKERGYTEIVAGNAPSRQDIRRIFNHYGYIDFLKSSRSITPPGENGEPASVETIDYYVKKVA